MPKPFLEGLLLGTILVFTLASCSYKPQYAVERPRTFKKDLGPLPQGKEVKNLPALGQCLVDSLFGDEFPPQALEGDKLVVTTFSRLNDLGHASRFGQGLQEAVISALIRRGILVREVRAARAIEVAQGQGEFLLSREPEVLRSPVDGQFVMVGTYIETPTTVVVNARIMDFRTRTVLRATSKELVKTPIIQALLHDEKTIEPGVMDRLLQ